MISTEKSWLINNNGLYRVKDVPQVEAYLDLLNEPFDSFWTVESSGLTGNCGATIRLVKKLPMNSNVKQGLAVSEIPACRLIEQMSYDYRNESLLIADRNGNHFIHVNPELLGKADMEKDVLGQIGASPAGEDQYPIKGAGENFSVTYKKSGYNGWTYVSLISIHELTKQSRAIGWFTALVCLILLVLALAVAWIFSNRLYGPVKKLFRFASLAFQEDKSAKNGFEFIAQQIHRMMDMNSRLEHRLQEQVEQLKILFMMKLFRNELDSKGIEYKLESLGYSRRWSRLTVIVAQFDSLEGTRFTERDNDLLLFAVNNIVEEMIPPARRLTPIVLDHTQATVLLHEEEDESSVQDELQRLCRQVQQTIDHYLSIKISIGVSLPYEEPTQTREAYQEGLEALKNRFRLDGQTIVFYRDLPQGRYPIHTFIPIKVQSELSDAVKLAEREAAKQLLHQFFAELSKKQLGPKEYELWTARLLLDFVQLTHTLGIPYIPIKDHSSIFQQLFKWQTPREIEGWIWETVIEPIISAVEERADSQYKLISRQMVEIIHEEYEKELTLDGIAAKLHYNPNYISTVFRKETGISFSEYLAAFRHSKAIAYLLESDLSVKEISHRLRYNNSQNFIRFFRKIEGITPGQYREMRIHR